MIPTSLFKSTQTSNANDTATSASTSSLKLSPRKPLISAKSARKGPRTIASTTPIAPNGSALTIPLANHVGVESDTISTTTIRQDSRTESQIPRDTQDLYVRDLYVGESVSAMPSDVTAVNSTSTISQDTGLIGDRLRDTTDISEVFGLGADETAQCEKDQVSELTSDSASKARKILNVPSVQAIESLTVAQLCRARAIRVQQPVTGDSSENNAAEIYDPLSLTDNEEYEDPNQQFRRQDDAPASMQDVDSSADNNASQPRVRVVNGRIIIDTNNIEAMTSAATRTTATSSSAGVVLDHRHRHVTSASFRKSRAGSWKHDGKISSVAATSSPENTNSAANTSPIVNNDVPAQRNATQSAGASLSPRVKKYTSRWAKEEVDKLYQGLTHYGLDFGVIQRKYLPHRSRHEVKLKFAREEKIPGNMQRIEEAIRGVGRGNARSALSDNPSSTNATLTFELNSR